MKQAAHIYDALKRGQSVTLDDKLAIYWLDGSYRLTELLANGRSNQVDSTREFLDLLRKLEELQTAGKLSAKPKYKVF